MCFRLRFVLLMAAALSAKLGGWLLDGDPRRLRLLFPAAALLGGSGFWLHGRIRWRRQRRRGPPPRAGGPLQALGAAWREAFRILREDRAFRAYEIAFMLYGFGGAKVTAGTTDGSFRTKPLWRGHYDIHIQRKGASYRCALKVAAAQVRFDLHFGRKNLGQKSCKPMNPLAQGVPG